ncbi:PqiC family protein [Trinickia fusca]|uniref:Membrane integrity-associated transporter subunit PqiC n=1 Tax=Trinickia fusca TaxID=2419777 RepID=A0A494X6J9_9BURK|nr:PqiC family protein [Trinickia fusca]RKP43609.1 membrane integrity-associated transporter subunit PqiC [Trinickia fusca]
MKHALSFLTLILAAGALGGCGSSPVARFYTLKPDATLTSGESSMPLHVVVNPVTIPDLVDRPQIVTRVAGNRVSLDEFDRWAEPLKSDIARVIAADLGALLGSEHVSVFDTGADVPPVWRVRVDVMRFDSAPGDAVTVEAQWTVWSPKKSAPVTGRSLEHESVQGQGYDALVAAHDRALAAVSRDIESAIRTSLAQ